MFSIPELNTLLLTGIFSQHVLFEPLHIKDKISLYWWYADYTDMRQWVVCLHESTNRLENPYDLLMIISRNSQLTHFSETESKTSIETRSNKQVFIRILATLP